MKTMPGVSLLEEVDPVPVESKNEDASLGALRTARGLLPLEAVDVRATLEGLTAHVLLTQTFVNVHEEPLEATYIFPLPERGAVQRFRLQVGERIIEGTLKERGAARREYQAAIAQGHQAAIAEEERPGVFTLRVGNIPAGERARVHLEFAQPLPCVDGEAMFRIPLVVAPRYIPGTPLSRTRTGSGAVSDTDAVPYASRIRPPVLLPGFPNPVSLSIEVYFPPSDLLPEAVRSSLHTVIAEEAGEGLRLRVLAGERLNRDFILRFRLAERTVRTGLLLHPDEDGRGGTFALTVLPPLLEEQTSRPRDLVFVLDRSGSMSGWKMVTARRAGMRLVESLQESDRFAVYAFDSCIETPEDFGGDRLVPATFHNRTVALEFLNRVDHRGGTEMAQPLDLALSRLLESGSDGERDRILVLITDGQVGNENQLLKRLGTRLKHVRVHALGIDQAVNAGFLQQLADLGAGSSTLVETEDRLEAAIDEVQRKIGTPVLRNLHLKALGLAIEEGSVAPSRLADLFVGSPLVILGRYTGTGEGGMTLAGSAADGVIWTLEVPARVGPQPALPALWARQRLRELEDRYAITASRELERLIVEISLRSGVLCRFTSFVAVDRSRVVNVGGKQHQVTQAVEPVAGWAENQKRDRSAAPPAPCLAPPAPSASGSLFACEIVEECDDEDEDSTSVRRLRQASRTEQPRPAAPPRDAQSAKKKERALPPRPRIRANRAPSGAAPGGILQVLSNVGASIVRGVKGLFALAQKASANPVDRSRYALEIDEILVIFGGTTTYSSRVAVLGTLLPRIYALFQQIVQGGDFAPEVVRLGQALEGLSQVVSSGGTTEETLTPWWLETHDALTAYRALIEPEGFWK